MFPETKAHLFNKSQEAIYEKKTKSFLKKKKSAKQTP